MKNKNSIKLKQLYTRRKSTKPKVGVFKKITITAKFLARLLEGTKAAAAAKLLQSCPRLCATP